MVMLEADEAYVEIWARASGEGERGLRAGMLNNYILRRRPLKRPRPAAPAEGSAPVTKVVMVLELLESQVEAPW